MLYSQIEIFHWLLNNKRQQKTQEWLFVSGLALLNLGLNARLCLLDPGGLGTHVLRSRKTLHGHGPRSYFESGWAD